ncbi:hypothetical protein V6N13_108601 [Hibiscus sabdariffa]|uniref:SMP-LTD domain-containing protein n=1 Tax=Hibiscus sabdariffa TaxID=183260 RepID=A0ABR2SSP3_9ROSI
MGFEGDEAREPRKLDALRSSTWRKLFAKVKRDFAIDAIDIPYGWGKSIRLDTDTIEKNRLDIAKILIGIKCSYAIPPLIPVKLNGSINYLKLSIVEFDDEHCWIDNDKVKSFSEGSSECSLDGEATG